MSKAQKHYEQRYINKISLLSQLLSCKILIRLAVFNLYSLILLIDFG